MYQARDDFLMEEGASVADVFFVALHLGFILLGLRNLAGHDVGIEGKVEAGDVDGVLGLFGLLNVLSTLLGILSGFISYHRLLVPTGLDH